MKTYVFLYDGFANFEVAVAAMLLRKRGDVLTLAATKEPVVSEEGFTFLPDRSLDETSAEDMDVLVFPGGAVRPHSQDPRLIALVRAANERDVLIGAICAGPLFLADAGILEGRRCTSAFGPAHELRAAFADADHRDAFFTVRDDNIVTAIGSAYVEFAIVLGHASGIFESDADECETYAWLKNEQ